MLTRLYLLVWLIGISATAAQAAEFENACSASDRAEHIYRENTDFSAAMDRCGRQAMGEARGTARCLVKRFPSLSLACATCFGQTVSCTVAKCMLPCTGGPSNSEPCVACYKTYCQEPLVSCSGVPADEHPRG